MGLCEHSRRQAASRVFSYSVNIPSPHGQNSPPDYFGRPYGMRLPLFESHRFSFFIKIYGRKTPPVYFWRKRWDSNPRAVARYLISSQGRYDLFDTLPYKLYSVNKLNRLISSRAVMSCCGTRKNCRDAAASLPPFFRPLPFARLALSSTGGAAARSPLRYASVY